MGDYRELRVWDRAHRLVLEVYIVTRTFPRDELYGLTAQMRRAAVSIPANLADGCGRDTDKEIVRYARISLGSASELEYYFRLSAELGYLSRQRSGELVTAATEVKSMLAALAISLADKHRRS